VTAIRACDTDGNPETQRDPNWIGLVIAPNHPEYPAAHGCFSAASTETLKFFFGTDEYDFFMESKVAGLANPVRHYTAFSQALSGCARRARFWRHALPQLNSCGRDHRETGLPFHDQAFLRPFASRRRTWARVRKQAQGLSDIPREVDAGLFILNGIFLPPRLCEAFRG
jgi:hypothetical protein